MFLTSGQFNMILSASMNATDQCCCQGRGQGLVVQGPWTRAWKLVLEDPRGQGLSSRTTTLQ